MSKEDGRPMGNAAWTPADDDSLRRLFERDARMVDTNEFRHMLNSRIASACRRARRRPAIRRALAAGAALLVAGAVGIGTWQAAEHLRPTNVLIIGDTVETAGQYTTSTASMSVTAPTSGLSVVVVTPPPVSFAEPRSLTLVHLEDIWQRAAEALTVDPASARVASLEVKWAADGLLSSLDLTAATPDGRMVSVTASADTSAAASRLSVFAQGVPYMSSDFESLSSLVMPAEKSLMPLAGHELGFATVAEVLQELDAAGLMRIGAQSGVDLSRPPAVSLPDSSTEVADKGSWFLQLAVPAFGGNQKALSLAQGKIESLDMSALSWAVKYGVGFDLLMEWVTKDKATGESKGSMAQSSGVCVVLPTVAANAGHGGDVAPRPADARIDGLAFAASDGTVCRIEGGKTQTVWQPNPDCPHLPLGYGAGYSLHHTMLLLGASIVSHQTPSGTSTVFGGMGSGSSYSPEESWESTGQAVILAAPTGGSGEPQELLRYRSLAQMNRVAYDEKTDRVWLTAPNPNLDKLLLWTAQPHTSKPVVLPLAGSFGGDFAVSPDASSIFYIGGWQVPAEVSLHTTQKDAHLALGLATAYSPVFSPDGTTVCLVGSKRLDEDASLWLYDLRTGQCRQLAATTGLDPTYPAFSPDGRQLAFRDWRLGDLWTVGTDGEGLTRYALALGDAPIAW